MVGPRIALLLACLFLAGATVLPCQGARPLRVGDRVRVQSWKGSARVEGRLRSLTADSLVLQSSDRATHRVGLGSGITVDVWRTTDSHGMEGAAAGFLSGAIVGVISAEQHTSRIGGLFTIDFRHGSSVASAALEGGAIGAVAGLIVGHFIHSHAWQPMLPGLVTSLGHERSRFQLGANHSF